LPLKVPVVCSACDAGWARLAVAEVFVWVWENDVMRLWVEVVNLKAFEIGQQRLDGRPVVTVQFFSIIAAVERLYPDFPGFPVRQQSL